MSLLSLLRNSKLFARKELIGVRRNCDSKEVPQHRIELCADEKRNKTNSEDDSKSPSRVHYVFAGVYKTGNELQLSPFTKSKDEEAKGQISKYLKEYVFAMELGNVILLNGIGSADYCLLTCLGPEKPGYNLIEDLNQEKENLRIASAVNCRVTARYPGKHGVTYEAGTPELRFHQEFIRLNYPSELPSDPIYYKDASAQRWARQLLGYKMAKKTPVEFAQVVLDVLCPLGVKVEARDLEWIKSMKMEAFLAASRGSCEEPILLECRYNGDATSSSTVLMCAHGATYDCGGLSLKNKEDLTDQISMGSAAVTVAIFKALATTKTKLNVACVIPLCENVISGQCSKAGDVVRAMDGTSIMIEDTNLEGHLMMADALIYGQTIHNPSLIVNVTTLANGVTRGLASAAFGCFTGDEELWRLLHAAGAETGDRPWRLPLWNYYTKQITNDSGVDLRNKGSGHASSCLGAAFLQLFVKDTKAIHLDISGVVNPPEEEPRPSYLLGNVPTGRPTRALLHFLRSLEKKEMVSSPNTPVNNTTCSDMKTDTEKSIIKIGSS